jgi:hypothetical protein
LVVEGQKPTHGHEEDDQFSRGGAEAVVKEINAAKSNILVQAYSLTSVPIAKLAHDH